MPGMVVRDLSLDDVRWVVDHTRECSYCAKMLGGYRRIDELLIDIGKDDPLMPPPPPVPGGRVARVGHLPSPLGTLLVAVSDRGLCEIGFADHEDDEQFHHNLRQRGFRTVTDEGVPANVITQLSEYFGRERDRFEVPLDLFGVTPFTKAVLEATSEIPFGRLGTYRSVAEKIGQPSATRAVGNALGRNPIPIVIPCHRVVRSDSSLGGYTGGLRIKERLLQIEGVLIASS